MRAPIFTLNWSRWGVGFGGMRFDARTIPVPHPYVRWSFYVRLGPFGLDFEKTIYTKEN